MSFRSSGLVLCFLLFTQAGVAVTVPPTLPCGVGRRTAPRRKSSRGRCAGSAAAHRTGEGCAQPRSRCAAAAFPKSSRSFSSMVNSRVTPVSASCRTTSPISGSSTSRGSRTSIPSTSCRPAMARSGRIQLIGPEEIADDHRHAAPAFRTAQRVDRRGQVAANPHLRLGDGRDRPQQVVLVHPAGQCRHPDDVLPVGDDRAEPVAAAAVEKRDRRGGGHRQVALLAARRCRSPGLPTCRPPATSPARGRRSSAARVGAWCGRSPTSPSGGRRRRADRSATLPARTPDPGAGPR